MSQFQAQMSEWYRSVRSDIFKFSHSMGLDPTPHQRQLFQAIQEASDGTALRKVAAKSGQGTGKSAATCIGASWRALRYPDALSVVTAPTMRQCTEQWLAEFRKILDNARDPIVRRIFTTTKTRVIIGGRTDWGIRFVTANKPEAAQGIHNDHLSLFLDECSGIERPFVEQAMGTLTNEDFLAVSTGNPNTRDCAFFDFFNRDRSRWRCMTFKSSDSPIATKEQAKYIIETYGKESNVYRVRVDGEFPDMDSNCIISSDDLEQCVKTPLYEALRRPRYRNGAQVPAKQIGIDFARFGADESVIVRVSGHAMLDLKFFSHMEPQDVVGRAFMMQNNNGWSDKDTCYCADANGMGEGVMYNFRKLNKNIFEFKAQRKATKPDYENIITEAWFEFAKKVKEHSVRIIDDPILFNQLSTRKYYIKPSNGKLMVESKEDYMEGGKESPDRADATVMAFFDGSIVQSQIGSAGGNERPISRVLRGTG